MQFARAEGVLSNQQQREMQLKLAGHCACSWHMTLVLAKQVRTSIANCISQLKNKFSHPTHPLLLSSDEKESRSARFWLWR
jgi:hypothetical protein